MDNSVIKMRFFAFFVLCFVCTKSFSQFSITYPVGATPLTVCSNPDILTVRIALSTPTSLNNQVEITLAPGVEYIPGSVVKTAGNLNITYAGGTVNVPKFNLSPTTAVIADYIVFKISRKATCASIAHINNNGVFKDIVKVTGSAGTVTENDMNTNAYVVNKPNLVFTAPATQNNAVLNQNYTRTFTISNGATACANAVYFSIDYPNSGIQFVGLTLAGNTITPTAIVGTTYYFSISGSLLTADQLLCGGESLTFIETYKVKKCDAQTNYAIGWGCDSLPASWCQTVSGSGSVSMATGVPNVSLAYTRVTPGDFCTGDVWRYTYTNNGTQNTANAGTAFNIIAQLGTGTWSTPQVVGNYLSNSNQIAYLQNFTINGVPVNFNVRTAIGQGWTLDLSQLTSDPDGAGGLTDADGDGQFDDLPVGASFQITYELKWEDATNYLFTSCNPTFDITPNARIDYGSMCGTAFYQYNTNPIANRYVFSSAASTLYSGPTDVNGGTPFTGTFSLGIFENVFPSNGVNSQMQLELQFTLPAGIAISGTGNPTFVREGAAPTTGTPTVTQVGNVVTLTFPHLNGPVHNITMGLDFITTCPAGEGLVSMPYEFHIYNNQCTTKKYKAECGTMNVTTHCPCSPSIGVSNGFASAVRTTLGWTDNTLTTYVNPASLPASSLKKVLPDDVANISLTSVQSNEATYNNLYLYIKYGRSSATNPYLTTTGLTQTVKITDASTGNVYTCALPTFTETITATYQERTYNLTSLVGTCLPAGFQFEPGDTYELSYEVKYTGGGTPGLLATLLPDSKVYFYNLNGTNSERYCNNSAIELYLIPINSRSATLFGQTTLGSGCNGGFLTGSVRQSTLTEHDPFPNEFRPSVYIDQMVFTLPTGFTFDASRASNVLEHYFSNYPGNTPVPITTIPSTTPTVVGNVITYTNDGTWPLSDQSGNQSSSMGFRIPIVATCASNVGTTSVQYPVVTFRPNYYANNLPPVPSIPGASIPSTTYNAQIPAPYFNKDYNGKPAIALSNQSGSVQAARPTESFVVRMASTGTTTAPYTWMSIPTVAGVSITQIVDVATNTPLTLLGYTGGVWAKLSITGLASGATKDYRIDFTYTTCNSTTFTVEGGWNCTDYPTDPVVYTCGKSSVSLTFTPQLGSLSLQSINEPTGNVDLCTNIPYQYRVISSGAGNIKNSTFKINLPTGASIVAGTLKVEYPQGSNNWLSVTSSTSGNIVTVDLFNHASFPAQGIPGVLLSTSNASRYIDVKFELKTSCTFVSGSRLVLSAQAYSSCGSLAANSNVEMISTANYINGASPSYTTANDVNGPTNVNCATANSAITFNTTILNGTTGTNQYINIVLPIGVTYVANSISCSSGSCPTFVSSSFLANGKQKIIFTMPSGLSHSQSINYQIQINTSGYSTECGSNRIDSYTSYFTSNVSCPTEPSGVCASTEIITGTGVFYISINKPALNIALNGFRLTNSPNAYDVTVNINNTGSVANISTNTLTVKYYCADSSGNATGSLIASQTINAAINPGQTLPFTTTFTNAICNYAYGIVAVLSSSDNCVCTSVSKRLIPSYLNANDNVFNISGCSNGLTGMSLIQDDVLNGVAPLTSNITTSFISSTNSNISLNGTDINVNSGTAPGTYNLVYQICENLNPRNCDTATAVINVSNSPTASISGYGNVCSTTGTTVTVNLTGAAPWNITYTNGTTQTTITGITASPYTFTVSPTTQTTYTLVSVSDARCTAHSSALTGSATVDGETIWLGNNSNWNNPANWSRGVLPTGVDCVVVPPTANNPVISGTSYTGFAGTLKVLDGAILTVQSDNYIKVTDWILVQPSATFIIENNASLVQINNVANTGNIIYKRNALIRTLDYVYWSSPVANFNVASIASPVVIGPIYIWNTTVNNPNGGQGNWEHPFSLTMQTGKGYIVQGPEAAPFNNTTATTLTASFTGVPNNGTITFPISRGNDVNTNTHYGINGTEITNLSDNFNLIGNPYPSAIRASQFLYDNNSKIVGNIKIWTHNNLPAAIPSPFYDTFAYNYNANDYISYNFTGTSCCPTAASEYFIGGGQGFFVQMIDGTAASDFVTFTNSLRSNAYPNSTFYKLQTNNEIIDIERNRIWLDIINESGNSYRTLFGYIEGATNANDSFFDAEDTVVPEVMSIYSKVDSNKFIIQGRQLPFDINDEVEIGVNLDVPGTYSIGIAAIDGLFDTQNIYLKDNYLNIYHDLKISPYTFTSVNSGTINDRFKVVYKTESLGNQDFSGNENAIKVFANNEINVLSNLENIESVLVYNILGQKLAEVNHIDNKLCKINTIVPQKATLLVKVKTINGNQKTVKVLF